MAGLTADHPGLLPVCFHSPYEAATWAIIGNRIRMPQAAAIKAHIAHQHGHRVHIEARQGLYRGVGCIRSSPGPIDAPGTGRVR